MVVVNPTFDTSWGSTVPSLVLLCGPSFTSSPVADDIVQ